MIKMFFKPNSVLALLKMENLRERIHQSEKKKKPEKESQSEIQ